MNTANRRTHTPWPVPMVVVLAICAAVGVTPIQAQVSSAVVEVHVVFEEGEPMPGATVEIVNVDSAVSTAMFSDTRGVARFPSVPPGAYNVSCQFTGYNEARKEDVAVRVGQTVKLRVTMTAQLSETVQVTARAPVVDVLKTDVSTNIVPEQIQSLPVPDRDFQRLAFITPGVQRERGGFRFITGGPVIGGVGNASQSTILVDGLDYTDQALGLARTRFSQDAIQEFRVISNRFDAEIGGSAGGALSIVTRSGTNELSGTVFGFYRADSLRATGALEQEDVDFERLQGGFTLGGPLVKNRSHYFLSLEQISNDDVALFRPGGVFTSLARDIPNTFDQTLGLVRIDHQINDKQSLSAKIVYERYREENFRVGGVQDVSYGQELNRDNWNLGLQHSWVLGSGKLNELRFQIGSREYDEPTNSNDPARLFSFGQTMIMGTNVVGSLIGEGDYLGVSDTFYWSARGAGVHNFKAGVSATKVEERSVIDVFDNGYFVYAGDPLDPLDPVNTAPPPFLYVFGIGSSDVTVDTNLLSAFIQDDWQVSPKCRLNLGLRYDLDTDGNNPDFTHTLMPNGRDTDDNNIQPRFGFSWDLGGDGRNVIRGGAGLFTGRYLLVPSFTELQQNGESGRLIQQRLNGLFLGPPFDEPPFILDPNDPQNTGVALLPDIGLLAQDLVAPEATQASLGWTSRIGDTGLYFDAEVIRLEGEDEIVIRDTNFGGNSNPVRLNPAYNQINTYTNDGRSKYKALVLGLNGTLADKHIITASMTLADKKNLADDFSPAFPSGYPSDPADIDAEWGRSRVDERYRLVVTGIFRLPWNVTLAPIFEYGDGQPWNRILGYDANGDGKASDRASGVKRNDEDGPPFRQLSLRVTKLIPLAKRQTLEVIVEAFNVLDTRNFDVSSVDNAEFLAAGVPNPNFGNFRATLAPREVQVGVRYSF